MADGTRWGYIGPRDMVRDLPFERKPKSSRSRVVDSIDFTDPNMAWLSDLAKVDDSNLGSPEATDQSPEQT